MARIAKKTTFGTENVGGGVEVRRQIVAGQQVPSHYEVDDKAAVEDTDDVRRVGAYSDEQITRRVGADGRVKASAHSDDAPLGDEESAKPAARGRSGSGKS